jgi:hypothetical protein
MTGNPVGTECKPERNILSIESEHCEPIVRVPQTDTAGEASHRSDITLWRLSETESRQKCRDRQKLHKKRNCECKRIRKSFKRAQRLGLHFHRISLVSPTLSFTDRISPTDSVSSFEQHDVTRFLCNLAVHTPQTASVCACTAAGPGQPFQSADTDFFDRFVPFDGPLGFP